jgi:hypothetical protein
MPVAESPQFDAPSEPAVTFCIPVFNDWPCALKLLEQLDETGPQLPGPMAVVFVDDGSKEPVPTQISMSLRNVVSVDVLQLRRNVGHQRAIALGIAFIHANVPTKLLVVMDADGEDSPHSVPELIRKCEQTGWSTIVFAARRKRAESLAFRSGYTAYRIIHYWLTGRKVSIGNFSVIPEGLIPRVVGVSELWNHYAAGIVHSRLPIDTVPIDRARRLSGEPKMNLVSLVAHGMSAISVFGDVVGVRLLCVASILTTLVLIGILLVIGIRVFTDFAIPGWATNALGLLAVVLLNLLTLSVVFVLFVLQSRNIAGFLPVRDWESYVASRRPVYRR